MKSPKTEDLLKEKKMKFLLQPPYEDLKVRFTTQKKRLVNGEHRTYCKGPFYYLRRNRRQYTVGRNPKEVSKILNISLDEAGGLCNFSLWTYIKKCSDPERVTKAEDALKRYMKIH